MRPISKVHVADPGPAVVEIAACDDQTVFAVQELLAARWTIEPTDRMTRQPVSPVSGCALTWTYGRHLTRGTAQGRAKLVNG
ncbi:DUF6207 family protein [Streptomyces sp. NPDC093982]|uniref:DUF6207 family protein n=1 Tax=Streptomyces sp. NPDC093982 TaxID=3155077 RepID=UPI003441BC5B